MINNTGDGINITEILNKAIFFHKDDQYQLAHNLYRAVLNYEPDNVHALHLLGILLIQHGFEDAGRELLEKAISLCKDSVEPSSNPSYFDINIQTKWQSETDHIDLKSEWPAYNEGTTDRWRHLRMLDFAGCFTGDVGSWLTIGDYHGHDSIMLKEYGIHNVVASNLNSSILALGHKAGFVGDYLTINAERIPLEDNSFDYVLCKEALHHMPRPMLAIYEMLRVARKAIFLIEPQDKVIDLPIVKDSAYWFEVKDSKLLFGSRENDRVISDQRIDWWEDGPNNYVYTLSKREIRKICFGMGLPAFMVKGFNDFYDPAWAVQPATDESDGFIKTCEQIRLWDYVCSISGKPSSYLTAILFKRVPVPELSQKLQNLGYAFNLTPTRYLPIKWPQF